MLARETSALVIPAYFCLQTFGYYFLLAESVKKTFCFMRRRLDKWLVKDFHGLSGRNFDVTNITIITNIIRNIQVSVILYL